MQANRQGVTNVMTKSAGVIVVFCALALSVSSVTVAEDKVCFESREGASKVTQKTLAKH